MDFHASLAFWFFWAWPKERENTIRKRTKKIASQFQAKKTGLK